MFFNLLIISLIAANEPSKNIFREKIEVHVGSEIITTTDLELMVENLRPLMAGASETDIWRRARDIAIDQKLMSIQLRKNEMSAAIDNEVEKRLNSVSGDKNFKQMLEAKNLTIERFRASLKTQLEKSQFMNLIRRNAAKTPDENDLKMYFKNLPEQAKRNFEIELSECFIPFGAAPQDARQKAEFFVKNPSKFGDCVKNISQSQSAAKGGKIGSFTWGVLPEDVESRVAHLKAGEIALNHRPDGLQLLKVEKSKSLGPVTFELAKDRIREHLENEIWEQEYNRTLSDLRANTFIKIES